jgi:DNA-binding Lrp family transcriptional regulator
MMQRYAVALHSLRTMLVLVPVWLNNMFMPLDELDARIITLFTEQPQIGVLGASRQLGVARGTVQARLDRLVTRGVIRSWAPQLNPAAMGYPVSAFCTLEIRQRQGHTPVVEHLSAIPEVLEAHTITGSGDLFIHVVARDNADLQRVIDAVVDDRHVIRANTAISLATRIERRTLPLVRASTN